MKTLAVACMLLLASFSAEARGHASSSGLQRSPSAHSFMFAPLHHARPDLKGRPLHELSIGKRRQLHRLNEDNTVSVFI